MYEFINFSMVEVPMTTSPLASSARVNPFNFVYLQNFNNTKAVIAQQGKEAISQYWL